MLVRITSKRQVTLPAHVLDTLGVQPGDHLQLEEGPGGFTAAAVANSTRPCSLRCVTRSAQRGLVRRRGVPEAGL